MGNYMKARNASEEATLARLKAEWETLSKEVQDTHGLTFADRQAKLKRMDVLRLQIERLEPSTRLRKEAAQEASAPRKGGFLPPRTPSAPLEANRARNRRPRSEVLSVGTWVSRNGTRFMAREVRSEVLGHRQFEYYEPVGSVVGNSQAPDPFANGGFLRPR